MRPILTDRVAWSVGLSVCRSVTLVSPAKTAAPIKLPFGLRTWVGLGNHVSDPPMGRGKFWGENGHPIVKYRDTLRSSEPIGMLFVLRSMCNTQENPLQTCLGLSNFGG